MKIHDCKQGSTEWHALRCAIPTASEFSELVTPKWKVKEGDGPRSYTFSKLAAKVLGYAPESVNTFSMGQGTLLESEALPFVKFNYGIDARAVGFCTTDDGRAGCSPDGLIGDESGIEIKCPAPHTHLEYLADGVLPSHYAAQVQGCMFVTGRDNWRFLSYSRFFPPLLITVHRDPKAQEAIATALDLFWDRFTAAEAKLLPQIAQKGRD